MEKDQKILICDICHIHPRKYYNGFHAKYCIRCTNKLQNASQCKGGKYEKKSLIDLNVLIKCIHCNEDFKRRIHNQKQCYSKLCLLEQAKKRNEESFMKENAKGRKKPNSKNVEYSFFNKQFGISNVYKACRG